MGCPMIQYDGLDVAVVPWVLSSVGVVAVRREMSLDSVKGPLGLTSPVVFTFEIRAVTVRTTSADVTARPMWIALFITSSTDAG